MKISVITPIYKGQKYINRLISMMYSNYMQFISKKFNDISVEYILVNDSPDKKINMDKHMDIFNNKQKGNVLVKQKNINYMLLKKQIQIQTYLVYHLKYQNKK